MLTRTDRYEIPTGRHTRYSVELTLRSAGSHSGDNLNDLSYHRMTHLGTSSEIKDRSGRCYSEVTLRRRINKAKDPHIRSKRFFDYQIMLNFDVTYTSSFGSDGADL